MFSLQDVLAYFLLENQQNMLHDCAHYVYYMYVTKYKNKKLINLTLNLIQIPTSHKNEIL